VAYGLKTNKTPNDQIKREVAEVLSIMSLEMLANRAPNQLSGGQQQRVALARAMVMKPKVLLFDEPLSNLDAKLRAQMRIEIRQLQQRLGITSIFVTHDQDEAMSISDRIVVMRNAKIEQVGTPAEIYLRPKSVFVADFVGRSNFLKVSGIKSTGNGRAQVTLNGKEIEVGASADAISSSSALLLVRPESIKVEKSSSTVASDGFTEGKVSQVVFYGEHVEYTIETQSGELIAVVSNPVYEEIVPVGSVAKYSFDQNRAWLVSSDK
jgi:iron(III) transport system ATP-binding protein